MVKRRIENDVKSAMAARRGVFLTGARQSGKTTLASMLKFANAKRLTLDNAGVRVAAQTDGQARCHTTCACRRLP